VTEDEVKAAWLVRVHGSGEDPLAAMSNVLFERLSDDQLNEYLRLLHDLVCVDGVRDFSPERMYAVAQTACFNLKENA
jgi:hypothetical protein